MDGTRFPEFLKNMGLLRRKTLMMSDCKSPGCAGTVPGSESPSAVDPRVCESTVGEKLLLETKEQD